MALSTLLLVLRELSTDRRRAISNAAILPAAGSVARSVANHERATIRDMRHSSTRLRTLTALAIDLLGAACGDEPADTGAD
jgi:hypothetical protein